MKCEDCGADQASLTIPGEGVVRCVGCHAEALGLTREGEIPEANYVACLVPVD